MSFTPLTFLYPLDEQIITNCPVNLQPPLYKILEDRKRVEEYLDGFGYEIVGNEKERFPLFNFEISHQYFPLAGAAGTPDVRIKMGLALAGYSTVDLKVTTVDDNFLTISTDELFRDIKNQLTPVAPVSWSNAFQLVRGWTVKEFSRTFHFNRKIEIKSVTYIDGLLSIEFTVLGVANNVKTYGINEVTLVKTVQGKKNLQG